MSTNASRGGTCAHLTSGVASNDRMRRGRGFIGIVAAGFVFHSFRAGGALRLLNADTPLPEVLRRGRWRRPESARPYLQRLRALCAAAAIPAPVLARGALWAVEPSALLAAWCV